MAQKVKTPTKGKKVAVSEKEFNAQKEQRLVAALEGKHIHSMHLEINNSFPNTLTADVKKRLHIVLKRENWDEEIVSAIEKL